MKIQSIACYLGYVESQTHAELFLTHRKGFNSLEEAFADLRQAFIDAETAENGGAYYKDCCTDARTENEARKSLPKAMQTKRNKPYKYCPDCGRALEWPKSDVRGLFEEFFNGEIYGTYEQLQALENHGWEVGSNNVISWNNCVTAGRAETLIESVDWTKQSRASEPTPAQHLWEGHVLVCYVEAQPAQQIFKDKAFDKKARSENCPAA